MENVMPEHLSYALTTAEGGRTFLGEDWPGWRTALIAAVVTALAWEAALALLRTIRPRVVRFMTLRLPFLLLASARLTVSSKAWNELRGPLTADLWDILKDDQRGPARRFVAGMAFSVSLAFGGALRTARALETEVGGHTHRSSRTRRTRRLVLGMAVVIPLIGMNGPWLYKWISEDHFHNIQAGLTSLGIYWGTVFVVMAAFWTVAAGIATAFNFVTRGRKRQ